eukprot:CAMPEP_0185731218 /NCGR_PEP_ID=MMETSP1171-20130828/12261_1 /TAXON_ID=374046 /ORGANISM="Helicotheca tamensis, Strain CCMP826" /LENGTH=321 /DNA_ID=CAMNT_0028400439 /DNA_START=72 /DNA_END=1034 /DNA_ORIENTATION=+
MKYIGLLLSSLLGSSAAKKIRGTDDNEVTGRELMFSPFEECMARISTETEWPIPNSDPVDTGRIDSAFGPVHSVCLDQDIFHKGIAVFGHPDDPVVAPYDGKVVMALADCVVIEHIFTGGETCQFHGDLVKNWYSLFLGMKDVGVVVGADLTKGDQIGKVGHHACKNGDHVRTSVEYQIRVGSRFSLKTAIKDGYAQSYEPTINPLFAHKDLKDPHVVSDAEAYGDDGDDVMISVRTMDDEPNVNRYEISCTSGAVHVLDLSLRVGFDPSDALAAFDKTVPYLDAQPFGNMRTHWTGHLIIPKNFMDASGDHCNVEIIDVW